MIKTLKRIASARGGSDVGFLLIFVGFIGYGAYIKFFGQSYSSAPKGYPNALQLYETKDKSMKLILYKERIHLQSKEVTSTLGASGTLDILISDLMAVRKYGNVITVYRTDKSEIRFDFNQFDPASADKFKDDLEALVYRRIPL